MGLARFCQVVLFGAFVVTAPPLVAQTEVETRLATFMSKDFARQAADALAEGDLEQARFFALAGLPADAARVDPGLFPEALAALDEVRRSYTLDLPVTNAVQVAISPDRTRLTTGPMMPAMGADGIDNQDAFHLWDATTGEVLHDLLPSDMTASIGAGMPPAVFSDDGAFVAATSSQDGAVYIWETATGTQVGRVPVMERDFPALSFQFDRSSRYLVAGVSPNRGALLVFDTDTRDTVQFGSGVSPIGMLHVDPSDRDGPGLVFLSRDLNGALDRVDLARVTAAWALQPIATDLKGAMMEVAIDGTTGRMAIRGEDFTVRVLEPSGDIIREFDPSEIGTFPSMAFSKDGSAIRFDDYEAPSVLIDLKTGDALDLDADDGEWHRLVVRSLEGRPMGEVSWREPRVRIMDDLPGWLERQTDLLSDDNRARLTAERVSY
ncbi:hypothetical protein JANAI62_36720 [Jannaschia pagri]|uniref:WD40 repeat domain-containing protein n=1 Tax=Jannaschia pagri TaxID=2829797 RepID=A0ABQ4NS20_9RHOB|nr:MULTISPECIES: WD40 repeat domain-containing protein [unclassified Jannaschia]GIT93184.1 hypothetical protein JANAI61_36420 [Jannaschia sp. AI_61]GIT97049.1 hypothetical protein JANAI62_36720 [Jannaschia sp. AI_62]